VEIGGRRETAAWAISHPKPTDSPPFVAPVQVKLLALPSFQPRGEVFLPQGQYARALAYGPGGMFFTGDSGGVVKCWGFGPSPGQTP
jgi:hypothetical protein